MEPYFAITMDTEQKYKNYMIICVLGNDQSWKPQITHHLQIVFKIQIQIFGSKFWAVGF